MLRYRFLFEQMVRRELRQKYKGSALGVLWYLVNPLVLMGAYALVFSVLLKVADIPDYPVFLLIGMIVWVFFAQALLAAAPSLVQNGALVRKVRFPRETIPASVATVQLVTFLVMLDHRLGGGSRRRRGTSSRRCCCSSRSWRCCSASCSACPWRQRPARPLPRRGAGSRRGAVAVVLRDPDLPAASTTSPGWRPRAWLGDLLQWANPVAPFIDAVREILYAGASRRRAGAGLHRRRRGAARSAAGCSLFRRMERDLAVIL